MAKQNTSISEVSKIEKIVDYSFERDEKSNVLAIHPSRPLIAYLINIQRTQKISKAWSEVNQSPTTPSNGQDKTVSIRIIDYITRQRCLAKGIYYSRPADCVFSINSLTCSQNDVVKLAVVDRQANVYLYDLNDFADELQAVRVAVIRSSSESPYESVIAVWCPFVPCEDFDDGDGGLRLAIALDSKLEIFAVDRLPRTGDMQRIDLNGAYRSITDANGAKITSLSISPDCSTVSASADDNRVTFYSSDIDDNGQRSLHNWHARASISKLFFLDDYPRLLEDSNMKFWGAAFIGTSDGQLLLVDLRSWKIYQECTITGNNFDYKIDSTAHNVVAMSGDLCYIIQIDHNVKKTGGMNGLFRAIGDPLPKIIRRTRLSLHHKIYSFVIKTVSDSELDLFTISGNSLERYTVNLNSLTNIIGSDATEPADQAVSVSANDSAQVDRLVNALFTKLNSAFSQGLEEFLNDVKCEVNDLKLKINGLSRDLRKVQQQLQAQNINQ